MDDMRSYQIQIYGRVEEEEINATSPLRLAVVRVEGDATLFTVRTDQSGLIGLVRYLHGLGFTLLSVSCI